MHGPRAPRARRRWLCWQCSLWLLRARAHPCTGLHARACRRIRARLRMRTCGHTPTPAGEAPGPRAPRSRRCCPTRDPIAPPTLAMVRTCTGFPAAERRQQHARRQGKARRLTQVPWAESRRPLAQPAALLASYGPERPILAMTVKVFFRRRRRSRLVLSTRDTHHAVTHACMVVRSCFSETQKQSFQLLYPDIFSHVISTKSG